MVSVSACIIVSIITLVKSILDQVQIQRSYLLREQNPLLAHIIHDIRIRNRYVVLRHQFVTAAMENDYIYLLLLLFQAPGGSFPAIVRC